MKLGEFVVGGAAGAKELKKHLENIRDGVPAVGSRKLTYKQRVKAKCFECTNGYADGRLDCEVQECPLYEYMPYKGKKFKSKKDKERNGGNK